MNLGKNDELLSLREETRSSIIPSDEFVGYTEREEEKFKSYKQLLAEMHHATSVRRFPFFQYRGR